MLFVGVRQSSDVVSSKLFLSEDVIALPFRELHVFYRLVLAFFARLLENFVLVLENVFDDELYFFEILDNAVFTSQKGLVHVMFGEVFFLFLCEL